MADAFQTLAQLVTLNDRNAADYEIYDVLNRAPVVASLPAVMASNGTSHKYVRDTADPATGFRAVSDGLENTKTTTSLVTVDLAILDASFAVDIELAKAYRGGVEAYLARETQRHLQSAFFTAEKQVFYGTGTGGSSAGFAGLANNALFDAAADTMVVNAGGSTANTGSSAWLIAFDPNYTGAAIIGGNDANITVGDYTVVPMAGSSTGRYPAYYVPVSGYVGLQLGSQYGIVRIANLTADSGKGLTDALIAQAIEKIPSHLRSTLRLVMNRRSQRQLQASRTATTATGSPAPFPEEAFGVPVIVTDAILSTEALLS